MDIPLVLHGCSGIPDESLKKAVSLGVRKINVNTELAVSSVKSIYEMIQKSDKPVRLEKAMKRACMTMEDIVIQYIDILKGC